MERTALTDGSGKWFDMEKAQSFENNYIWDGNNNVSMSAGMHNHETLYRTTGGRWVLEFKSQWTTTPDSYTEIDSQEAAKWFMKNEFQDDDIPDDLFISIKEFIDALEL